MTERETFKKAMQKEGFKVSNFQGQPFQGNFGLIPKHRKTREGTHNLISGIRFVIFGGSNTKKGEMGCVVFFYNGVEREKYRKKAVGSEILKKVFCPKSAKEALQGYKEWSFATQGMIDSWKVVI